MFLFVHGYDNSKQNEKFVIPATNCNSIYNTLINLLCG